MEIKSMIQYKKHIKMGIKHLNRFLRSNASESIKMCNLSQLSGKKIAVDISIYMYKFSYNDTLLENMYLMLSIFKYYNIIPLFIFDGKPPPEKRALLEQRKKTKQEALQEYTRLSMIPNNDCEELMDSLKRQFVNIKKQDVCNVKQLITTYGFSYYDAPEEADELCALLTIKGIVWACLSDDMDMFVYGCPRVLRYISLFNHNVIVYDMSQILTQLGITQQELREICVISGTDYNINTDENNNDENENILPVTLKRFKRYYKYKTNITNCDCFSDWLDKQYHCIKNHELLNKIINMFNLDTKQLTIDYENIVITNNSINKSNLQEMLKTDGFLFT